MVAGGWRVARDRKSETQYAAVCSVQSVRVDSTQCDDEVFGMLFTILPD